jgi:hypothetical protein
MNMKLEKTFLFYCILPLSLMFLATPFEKYSLIYERKYPEYYEIFVISAIIIPMIMLVYNLIRKKAINFEYITIAFCIIIWIQFLIMRILLWGNGNV